MFVGRVISMSSCFLGIVLAILGITEGISLMVLIGSLSFAIGFFYCTRLFFVRVDQYEALVVCNEVTGEFSRCLGVGLHLLDMYEAPDFRFKTNPVSLGKEIAGLRSDRKSVV